MSELLAVAAITVLAVISPGPDFAMVTRNSYSFGRKNGLTAALGIACGVQVHVFYTVFGIAVIITSSPILFLGMKSLGAGYLIYLGVRSLTNSGAFTIGKADGREPTAWGAFRTGFFTNALNPKTMFFVVAAYSQVVRADSSPFVNFAYGLFMSLSHFVWFSLVAVFFSAEAMRRRILRKQHIVDRVIGAALIGLGASLVLPGLGS
ncbi:LysE family translocator [Pseudomonas stutzeri]|uniref:Lysine transporter LysE n=1 Tax=Stutzerimonas stutzeri TaxID=316 RepID=A0A2N8S6G6_STUST|nr:LysE family translocator [Stutzerimonas stutzeri]MCQ4297715.1 LysE family translocator [Stutzerimonas stutzeri]PNF82209.1 lysine transporter LysE [Stutzerimonas stutzeri]